MYSKLWGGILFYGGKECSIDMYIRKKSICPFTTGKSMISHSKQVILGGIGVCISFFQLLIGILVVDWYGFGGADTGLGLPGVGKGYLLVGWSLN